MMVLAKKNPAMRRSLGKGRFSWDPMSTLVAARGAEAAGCSRSNSPGRNSINPRTGDNAWAVGSPVNQSYLLLKDGRHARQAVDELLCMPPQHTTPSGRSLASAPSDATPRSPTLPPSSPVEPPQIPSSSDAGPMMQVDNVDVRSCRPSRLRCEPGDDVL